MNKLKIILLLLFSFNIVNASVIVNQKYSSNVLNEPLKGVPYIYDYMDIIKLIEKQQGYKVINKIPDLNLNRKELKNETLLIGDFLNKLFDKTAVSMEVDDDKYKIVLTPTYSFFIEFPYGWDFDKIKDNLGFNYKEVDFKINGHRLYVYGAKKYIEKIKPKLIQIEQIANSKKMFDIEIKRYYSNEQDIRFVGFKKNDIFKKNPVLSRTNASLGHNDSFGFVFEKEFIQIKLDLVKNILILDEEKYINLEDLSELGYVISLKSNPNNKFIITFRERRNLL